MEGVQQFLLQRIWLNPTMQLHNQLLLRTDYTN